MGRDSFQPTSEQNSKSLASPPKGLGFFPLDLEYRRLTGRMEALSLQCHWSSLVAKGVMVGVEAPILSEAHGLGEQPRVGGYLMTLAKRVQIRKHDSIGR